MIGIGAFGQRMVSPEQALPGRGQPMPVPRLHHALGTPMQGPFEGVERTETACFGMGCFWGAERLFWQLPGVLTTAAGYAGGFTPNPTYEEVCSGLTGHAEVVQVIFDPQRLDYRQLLGMFWERHDPTQGMRQGNDLGSQYRSVIHCHCPAQLQAAQASADAFQQALTAAGRGRITTEIVHPAPTFYFAEAAHQQYLSKVPDGYCGLRGTGVSCPLP